MVTVTAKLAVSVSESADSDAAAADDLRLDAADDRAGL